MLHIYNQNICLRYNRGALPLYKGIYDAKFALECYKASVWFNQIGACGCEINVSLVYR